MEQWMVYQKKADFEQLGKRFGMNPIVARIIRNRDLCTEEEFEEYLHGGVEGLHAPMLMKDMEKAVAILEEKIRQKKKIRIVNDYDIDGVCSGYILVDGLKKLGADVDVRTPERMRDGYGLNIRIIEEAYEDGVDTILTCDNGIAAKEQIAYAKDHGMTVVVTDHHEVPYEIVDGEKQYILPPADAIVNPHQEECNYPYPNLCGAAVAYKLICQILGNAGIQPDGYMEFVAIATIGDVMELQHENRILTKLGLEALQHTKNDGLRALIDVMELDREKIDSETIGFQIGPCINATGRLDTAKRALDLFCSKSYPVAFQKAVEMKEWNQTRKDLTEEGTNEAIEQVEHAEWKNDKIYVIYLPDVHESLAGIIAGRIRERYNRPAFVFTDTENVDEDGNELIKGSGRSIPAYSMYEGMNECKELLAKFGGHKGAGGLSMKLENLEAFRCQINQQCKLTEAEMVEKVWIDVAAPFSYMSLDLVNELSYMEPVGNGNEKACFAQKGVKVLRMDVFGESRLVIRMKVQGEDNDVKDALYFDGKQLIDDIVTKYGQDEYEKARKGMPNKISMRVLYVPKRNEFRQTVSLQLQFTRIQLE